MWKYVSRRIRDVCDRTYNVLDVRRPWQCGGERFCAEGNFSEDGETRRQDGAGGQRNPRPSSAFCLLKKVVVVPCKPQPAIGNGGDRSRNNSEREGFRRKDFCPFQHSWVGAITWTSAIICGWYTSQLICLYRRNHKWEGPKCLPFLISSAHNIPRDLSSKCYPFSAPPSPPLEAPPNQQQQQHQKEHQPESSTHRNGATFLGVPLPNGKASRLEEFDFEEFSVVPVNNEDRREQKATGNKGQDYGVFVVNGVGSQPVLVEPKAPTVESAMENLMTVIGEIEYRLGVQNLEVGDYGTAVSHLKLGTSHQHAGAAFNLGICYEQGFGVKKNARVAMECFHLASTLGHPEAMYNLGVYYARGLGGLRRSRTMAKRYFTAAADLGLEQAIVALGTGYSRGGTRRDSLMTGATASSMTGGSTTPATPVVPFEFRFDYDELERYGFVAGYKSGAPRELEVQLVSAMG